MTLVRQRRTKRDNPAQRTSRRRHPLQDVRQMGFRPTVSFTALAQQAEAPTLPQDEASTLLPPEIGAESPDSRIPTNTGLIPPTAVVPAQGDAPQFFSDYFVYTGEDSRSKILSVLKLSGHGETAERIRQYLDDRDQDQDEPPIVLESLQSLAAFIVRERKLLSPIIGADPPGLLEAEWHLRDNGNPDSMWGKGDGIVSLKFQESGLIQFVALSSPHREGEQRITKRDESTREFMMTSLGEFAPKIKAP